MTHLDVRAISRRLLQQPALRAALERLASGATHDLTAAQIEPLIAGRLCRQDANGPHLTRLGRSIAYHLSELRIQIDESGASKYVSQLDINRNSRILDIGCGAGSSLVALSREQPRLAVGIDYDPVALALFAALREVEQLRNVIPVRGNSETLPFADASFDRVLCRGVLMHVLVAPTLIEIARVCTADSLVYLHLTDFWFYWRKLVRGRWERGGVPFALVNGVLLQFLGRQIRMRSTRTMSYQTVASISRRMENLGFDIVDIEQDRANVLGARHRQPKILARKRHGAGPTFEGAEA